MAESTSEQYFFGFCKFFSFGKDKILPGALHDIVEAGNEEDNMAYSSPTRIDFAHGSAESCVTWSTIFHLFKETGKVQVCGWGKGRRISTNENLCLPLDEKIFRLRASWNKLLLISEKGSCHVMWNVHDDWTVHHVTACSTNEAGAKGTMFSYCDVGDMHCIVVDKDGKTYQIEEDKSGLSNFLCSQIPLEIRVDEVSCGKEHVLLLNKEHGTVYSFGLGSRGQLGLGQVEPEKVPKRVEALTGIRIQQIAAGGWHSLALSEFGDVYAWGWNDCGQLGITCVPPEISLSFYVLPYIVDIPDEYVVTCVACGARHTVAVTSEPKGSVWTWGWGFYGQLGHGDTMDRRTPTMVEYFKSIDSQVSNITCGPWQTIVYTK